MTPRMTSFRSVWNNVMQNDIENSTSPERSVAPKRNPLSLGTSYSSVSSVTSIRRSHNYRADHTSETGRQNADLSISSLSLPANFDNYDLMDSTKSLTVTSSLGDSLRELVPRGMNSSDGRSFMEDAASNIPPFTSTERHTDALMETGEYNVDDVIDNLKQDYDLDMLLMHNRNDLEAMHYNNLENDTRHVTQEVDPCLDPELQHVTQSGVARSQSTDPLNGGLFRVIIFTDTHLGHKDSDPVRANDAFNTFQEVLFLAKYLQVDAIFHSGDLFDDSHPSRSVIYRTMELIRHYCQRNDADFSGSLDIQLPQSCAVRTATMRLTALKLIDVTVSNESQVPFFVIHGNHDNPTSVNGLSPIDLLDVSGLVTFFGTATDMNNIEIHPILINKQGIIVALYGLGWVKDEFLYKAFEENRVVFVPPPQTEQRCYNVLLFHQNRYPRRGAKAKDYIPDHFLPEWLDLVIWGHEHECLKFPQRSESHDFQVLQLGSTVQTSLMAGEMAQKHCCIMEISLDDVKFYPISLETARQLHYSDVSLSQMGLDTKGGEKEIHSKLLATMNTIVGNVHNRSLTALRATEVAKIVLPPHMEFELQGAIEDARRMPLVRLRVDHSGYDSINPRTFGTEFVNRVANPSDLLRFWQRHTTGTTERSEDATISGGSDIRNSVYPAIEACCQLKVLLERDLNAAVERFAVGMESSAIADYVNKAIRETQQALRREMAVHAGDQLCDEVYSNLVERAVIARTQAARLAAGVNHQSTLSGLASSSDSIGINISGNKFSDSVDTTSSLGLSSYKFQDNGTISDFTPQPCQRPNETAATNNKVDFGDKTVVATRNNCLKSSVDPGSSIKMNDLMMEFIPQSIVGDAANTVSTDSSSHSPLEPENDADVPHTLPLASRFRTRKRNVNRAADKSQELSENTGVTPVDRPQTRQQTKRSRQLAIDTNDQDDIFLDENLKRMCSEYMDKSAASDNTEEIGPMDHVRLNSNSPKYLYIDGNSRHDEPLKLSDFDDLVLPVPSDNASPGDVTMTPRVSNKERLMDNDSRLTTRNASNEIVQRLQNVNRSVGSHRLPSVTRTSTSSKGSQGVSSQTSYSQGFRNTLISMFFKKK
ncbi:DNA repair exonuclease [Babesia ovis]|uniref:DNA repair exonuclease n=1 Tax=Babesia ovis TaxID=5869 RepID=A0A9W5TBD3_BABOV|nr:DNA repair exonuclease [Babesia ovis]